MNPSSTIPAPVALPCLDWSQTSLRLDSAFSVDEEPPHAGPSFGPHICVTRFGGVDAASLDDCAADDMTAPELRKLAEDAISAAQWLEAHGCGGSRLSASSRLVRS